MTGPQASLGSNRFQQVAFLGNLFHHLMGGFSLAYWLVKTEPESYGYADLVRLGRDRWNGVRNFSAIHHIRAMNPGDSVFVYHTGKEKAIVGVAQVVSEPYPDPEYSDSRWTVVDMIPKYPLPSPVTLADIKAKQDFNDWELVRQPRLSVMPVSEESWDLIHRMAGCFVPV